MSMASNPPLLDLAQGTAPLPFVVPALAEVPPSTTSGEGKISSFSIKNGLSLDIMQSIALSLDYIKTVLSTTNYETRVDI